MALKILLENPLLLLFVIAGSGYVLGRITIGGSSLGVVAVLFVGLGVGALHPDLKVPEIVYQLGLVLFVYTIGLSSGPVFAMLAVDDEFFVIVRPIPGGATLLLSDATAGLDYDIAADVLDLLQVQVPEDDEIDDEPWPEGDLGLLADLGSETLSDGTVIGCRLKAARSCQSRSTHR